MVRALGIAAAIVFTSAGTASAGRSHFGWLYGSELVPERGVEVETWIVDTHKQDKAGGIVDDETSFWWGFVVAISEHVELAVPIEAEYVDDRVNPPASQFVRFGGEIRWRPQSPDPTDAGPLTSLYRFGVKRMIDARLGFRTEADAVFTYDAGSVLASVDLGLMNEYTPDEDVFEVRPAAGISFRLGNGWRAGAETYGEITVKGPDPSWQVVGPTVSLTRGRFWGAATVGIGMFGVHEAGRITLGAAL